MQNSEFFLPSNTWHDLPSLQFAERNERNLLTRQRELRERNNFFFLVEIVAKSKICRRAVVAAGARSRLETISRLELAGGGGRGGPASRYPGNKRKSKLTQRICPRTRSCRQMGREAEPCWRNKTGNKVTAGSPIPPKNRFMGSALDLIYNWFYPSPSRSNRTLSS